MFYISGKKKTDDNPLKNQDFFNCFTLGLIVREIDIWSRTDPWPSCYHHELYSSEKGYFKNAEFDNLECYDF